MTIRRLSAAILLSISSAFSGPPGGVAGPQAASSPFEEALLHAVGRADGDLVLSLLGKTPAERREYALPGAPWKRASHRASSPLSLAVQYNEIEIAQALIQHGWSATAVDGVGRAPIHFVRSPEMLAILLGAGADPNALDGGGESALTHLWDVHHGIGKATAAALIEAGSPVSFEDSIRLGLPDRVTAYLSSGRTPTTADLYRTIESGADSGRVCAIIQLLLGAGAKPNGPAPHSNYMNWAYPRSVVVWAIHSGEHDAACLLLRAGADLPDQASSGGWELIRFSSPSHSNTGDLLDRAIHDGHLGLTQLLLQRGYSPDTLPGLWAFDTDWITSRLNRAAWLGHKDIALELLRSGASHGQIPGDCDATLAAAGAGRNEVLDALITAGLKPTLHAAAYLGRNKTLEDLVADGNLNKPDGRMDCPPLAWALLGGQTESARLLISAGADLNAHVPPLTGHWQNRTREAEELMPRQALGDGSRGLSLVALAARLGQWDLTRELMEAGSVPDRSLFAALAGEPSPRATDVLRDALVVSKGRREPGWSDAALMRLARRRIYGDLAELPMTERMHRLDLLLGAGANLEMESGGSVLDAAARYASPAAVAYLLKRGAGFSEKTAVTLGLRAEGSEGPDLTSIPSKERFSMMWEAVKADRPQSVLRLLETAGKDRADLTARIAKSASWESPNVLSVLMESGVIGTPEDEAAIVELMSKQIRNAPLLKHYIDGGLSLEAMEQPSWTLLHDACSSGDSGAIALLLGAGLDPNRRTSDGKTTFELLFNRQLGFRRGAGQNALDCARLLLDAGADPLRVGYSNPANYEFVQYAELPESAIDAIEELMRPVVRGYLDSATSK